VEQVKQPFLKNKSSSIHEVANMFGISYGSVQSILKENMNIHQIAAKLCPSCYVCARITGNKQNDCCPTLPPHQI
jgi:hypothetical protein